MESPASDCAASFARMQNSHKYLILHVNRTDIYGRQIVNALKSPPTGPEPRILQHTALPSISRTFEGSSVFDN